jgi:cation transport ATPase
MAKKQKDKKINNGRHNNTQTDNIMTKKQKDKKINNDDTIINRQTDNIMAKKQKDKKINNRRHQNTPLYCLFVCVLLCRPLFIFLSFCFLAIILSVCLCIFVSTVVYLFVFLFLGHCIVCLSVFFCVYFLNI